MTNLLESLCAFEIETNITAYVFFTPAYPNQFSFKEWIRIVHVTQNANFV